MGGGASAVVIFFTFDVIWDSLVFGYPFSFAERLPILLQFVGQSFAFGLILGLQMSLLLWLAEPRRRQRRP